MGGGHSRLRYALIGLAAYSFHYDLSKSTNLQSNMPEYLIAFNDLHNFFVPINIYKQFFREEYLSTKLPLEPFDLNNPYMSPKIMPRFMTPQARLSARKTTDTWGERYFPETLKENVKILDDYLTLCEEKNIRPIIFLMPTTEGDIKHFNKQRLDEFYYLVGQACKNHSSAVFVDGWKLQGLSDTDFYDVQHLNIQGAAKFSAYLNDIIEQLDAQGR